MNLPDIVIFLVTFLVVYLFVAPLLSRCFVPLYLWAEHRKRMDAIRTGKITK